MNARDEGWYKKWKPPKFDEFGNTKWGWKVAYPENLKLGKYVDVGAFTYINAKYGVVIEDHVQIGSHCSIYSVSTIDNKIGKVIIKKGARIGSHCVVMPGITIGENAIIGAFSFINKNIPSNTIAFGIPVKVVRKLTEEDKKKFGLV